MTKSISSGSSGVIVDNFIEFILYPINGYKDRPLRLMLDTFKIIAVQDEYSALETGGNKKGTIIHTQISSFSVQNSYEDVLNKLNLTSSIPTQA